MDSSFIRYYVKLDVVRDFNAKDQLLFLLLNKRQHREIASTLDSAMIGAHHLWGKSKEGSSSR